MSYDLEIFHGDPAAPEETFRPLDCRLAWRVLEEALVQERMERDHDELLWYLPTRTVDIFIGHENEAVHSIGISMVWGDRSQPDFDYTLLPGSSPAMVQQQKADLTKVFIILQTLAEKLGAQVYDPQRGEFIPRAAIARFVEEFDHDADARAAMDYAGEESLQQTADADEPLKARQAVSFSPVIILIALFALGYTGLKMAEDGEMEPAEYVPVMEVLNEYRPASRRNAVPRAELWIDNQYIVHRGALKNGRGVSGMVWVIRADGRIIEERPADDEMAFSMARMRPGVVYSVQLKLYDGSHDGQGRAVSELITFSAPPAE